MITGAPMMLQRINVHLASQMQIVEEVFARTSGMPSVDLLQLHLLHLLQHLLHLLHLQALLHLLRHQVRPRGGARTMRPRILASLAMDKRAIAATLKTLLPSFIASNQRSQHVVPPVHLQVHLQGQPQAGANMTALKTHASHATAKKVHAATVIQISTSAWQVRSLHAVVQDLVLLLPGAEVTAPMTVKKMLVADALTI